MIEFIQLVKKMREAQRAYFSAEPGHDKSRHLGEAKELERKVDERLAEFESGQQSLFE